MKDTSSFLDLALDDSMGFDPLGAFDDDVDDDAEEVTEGYLGTPHTDVPAPVVDTRPGARAHRRPVQRHGAAPSHAARHDRVLRRAADHRRPGCRGGSPAGGQLLRVLPRFARELARARRGPRPRDRRRRAVPRGRPGAGARGSRRRVLLRGRRGAGGLLACHCGRRGLRRGRQAPRPPDRPACRGREVRHDLRAHSRPYRPGMPAPRCRPSTRPWTTTSC